MNTQANNFKPLDEEEQLISESFEAGEWQTVELTDAEIKSHMTAARRTLKSLKKKQISIKLNPVDISFVQAKAEETGIPYQNIIGALIHNYAIGKIKLEI